MTTQQTSTGPFSPLRLSTGTVHPFYIYGTAFKEDRAGELKALALKKGFRGVDSANYSSAYDEPSIRVAIEEALKSGVKREGPFVLEHQKKKALDLLEATLTNGEKYNIQVQTKFAPMWAHAESKLPYNADQP
ncbi:hypothetical protein E5D57_006940 [Metarhizium anisopliae]|nr:hypothetical protein E5D57_006940 [Metarhizium anisopliae]